MLRFPEHFSRSELIASQTAAREGIDNTPTPAHEVNLLRVAFFLETLRARLSRERGKDTALIVSSGYRSPALNAAVKGSKTSAHMQGLAADVLCPAMPAPALAQFIVENMADVGWDQVILEFGQWVHVGLSAGLPRQEVLTARRSGGRVVYLPGLVSEELQNA